MKNEKKNLNQNFLNKKSVKSSQRINTSWDHVADWYSHAVGDEGLYYHKNLILPNLISSINLNKNSKLLDLGCGEGILSRYIGHKIGYYLGIDLSPSLIAIARKKAKNIKNANFLVGDVSKNLGINEIFTHIVCILSIQNISHLDGLMVNVIKYLDKGGLFAVVLNHPCFRIPRLSSWGIDESKKLQYRRVDRYLSHLKIPINIHPSQKSNRNIIWHYHYPLNYYLNLITGYNLQLVRIEEWISDKRSYGKKSKMENRARNEFPLFLYLLFRK